MSVAPLKDKNGYCWYILKHVYGSERLYAQTLYNYNYAYRQFLSWKQYQRHIRYC